MQKFLFDTNAYNNLMDGRVDIGMLPKAEYYCTFKQYDELKATRNELRRIELLAFFASLGHIERPLETFVLGYARLDKTKLGNGELYNQILCFLNHCRLKDNNRDDALIAEAASKNGSTLVTNDGDLLKACEKFGIPAMRLQDIVLPTYP